MVDSTMPPSYELTRVLQAFSCSVLALLRPPLHRRRRAPPCGAPARHRATSRRKFGFSHENRRAPTSGGKNQRFIVALLAGISRAAFALVGWYLMVPSCDKLKGLDLTEFAYAGLNKGSRRFR